MADSTLDAVKQTSKTILFEEFDSSKPNLFDLLNRNPKEDPTTGNFTKDFEDKLEVHSYDEFLKKFQPKVYEIVGKDEAGFVHIRYTTDADEAKRNNGREKNIVDHPFYRMLQQMYEDKADSGLSNLDFDDKELLDMLKPEQEVEDAKDIRKQFFSAYEKYLELEAKGENTDDYIDAVVGCRKRIIKKYKNSFVDLLPIAIDDVKSKIKLLNPPQKENSNSDDESAPKLLTGRLIFNDKGELDVDPVASLGASNDVKLLPLGQQTPLFGRCRSEMVALLEKDYQQHSDNGNPYVGEMIVNTFAPPLIGDNGVENGTKYDLVKLNNQKDSYEKVYAEAKESFIIAVKDVCEKLLSVKIFFDHATAAGKFDSGLIVTNCKTTKLLQLSVKNKFEKLMKHEGEQVKSKVWIAIVPGVSDSFGSVGKRHKIDDDIGSDSTEDSSGHDQLSKTLTINSLKTLLKILGKNNILSFFSLKGSVETGFGSFNEDKLSDMKEKFSDLVSEYSQYAVLAFPNFNIVRNRKVDITGNSSISRVEVPGIFVDACYVAGGLTAGSQQIDYLRAKGFENAVLPENVCVRINLEDVNMKLITRFNLENGKRWISDLRKKLDDDMFGFVFCSDEVRENGHDIKNAYVYSARTLGKKDGTYRPIYRVLMEVFLNVYFQSKATKNEKTLMEMMEVDAHDWLKESQRPDNKNCVNLILKEGDVIYYDENDKKIHINYVPDPKRMTEIKIEGN